MKKIILLILLLTYTTTAFAHEKGDIIHSNSESYTIIKQLGEGFFGKVYQATDSAGNNVAIKSFKYEFSGDTGTSSENIFMNLLNDTQREYERGQLFDHPHIIKSYDLFTTYKNGDPEHYLVLEFVSGNTLYHTPKKSLSTDQSTIAAEHLVDGLQHALSMGYIHLDLHRNNIMINDDSDAIIIDLASFFSWQELIGYVKEKSSSLEQKRFGVQNDVIKNQKLEKFFASHTELFEKLQRMDSLQTRQFTTNDVKAEQAKILFTPYYSDLITDAVASIIQKSSLQKDTKLSKMAEIKKLTWSLQEDSEDGLTKTGSLDEFIEELHHIITPENT